MSQPAKSPRVHIGLDVTNLDASIAFYRQLFGIEPSKVRHDYAKFEPTSPPVNLALNQVEVTPERDSRVSHFGIQVTSPEDVASASARLRDAGLDATVEEQVTCCYAVQDKAWVTDPDGNAWEIFAVTRADAAVHSAGRSPSAPSFECCPNDAGTGSC